MRRRSSNGDEGSSSVEFAVLFPVIVVLLFAGPQLGMWYFAREAAAAAAQAGARAGSIEGVPEGAGREAADAYLDQLGTGSVSSWSISEVRTATTVSVRVVADVPNVIPLPGFSPIVDITVSQAQERFTTAGAP